MAIASPSLTSASGYAGLPATKPTEWHGLIAWDTYFNNLTTGLFLVAALADLLLPRLVLPVTRIAYPIALALLALDLILLVIDLGDPSRFHHMLRVFKPESPMSFGTWSLTVYSLPLVILVGLDYLPHDRAAVAWIRPIVLILGLLPALASAVYKGVLLSTNAQPGWRDGRWMAGYLANAALVLGCTQLLALAVWLQSDRVVPILRIALIWLLAVHLIPLWLLTADLRPALSRRFTGKQIAGSFFFLSGVGTILPLALLIVSGSPSMVLLAAGLILLTSLAARYVLLRIPHELNRRVRVGHPVT